MRRRKIVGFSLRNGAVIFLVAITLLFIFLQYKLWVDKSSVLAMLRLKQSLALQIKENQTLKAHNEMLLFQIRRLQQNENATEARARNELGMIKKGEIFYQIQQ